MQIKVGDTVGYISKRLVDEASRYMLEFETCKVKSIYFGTKKNTVRFDKLLRTLELDEIVSNARIERCLDSGIVLTQEPFVCPPELADRISKKIAEMNDSGGAVSVLSTTP